LPTAGGYSNLLEF